MNEDDKLKKLLGQVELDYSHLADEEAIILRIKNIESYRRGIKRYKLIGKISLGIFTLMTIFFLLTNNGQLILQEDGFAGHFIVAPLIILLLFFLQLELFATQQKVE